MKTRSRRSKKQLKQALETLAKSKSCSIKAVVAKEALSRENSTVFFQNLLRNGCSSGMISGLIYYVDTRAFYDQHYFEIEDYRQAHEQRSGEAILIYGDYKNYMAWFAYEEAAYQVATELGIDF
ncbi:MAG: DUF7222 domain-containing protein [Flavobacteriales bacterium]